MELKDTVELMVSADYKERFKAEYYQTEIRLTKLIEIIEKHRAGELDFEPACSIELLDEQAAHMQKYLDTLKKRVLVEGVKLD